MNSITTEQAVNFLAVVTFLYLTSRLAGIAFSLPGNLRRLRKHEAILSDIRRAISADGGKLHRISLNQLVKAFPYPAECTAAECTVAMLRRIIDNWRSNEKELAGVIFANWRSAISRNWEKERDLSTQATDWGLWYTVIGGTITFAHIGSSENPIGALNGMGLALVTTAAGLLIAIANNSLLRIYEQRLNGVIQSATDLLPTVVRIGSTRHERIKKAPAQTPVAAAVENPDGNYLLDVVDPQPIYDQRFKPVNGNGKAAANVNKESNQ